MRRKISLINFFQWLFVSTLTLLAGLLAFFLINDSYHQFTQQSKKIRAEFIANQKNMIKREVERVVERINVERITAASQSKQRLMARVDEALAVAENIYLKQQNKKSKAEIEELIKDALEPVCCSAGNGYYFIINTQGRVVLSPAPNLSVGQNILEKRDAQGRYYIREILEIAAQRGEGFCRYSTMKPDASGKNHQKLVFVKSFLPYGWVIGSGLYLSDIEKDLQQELLAEIGKIRFGQQKNGYIFIVSYSGVTLMNDTLRSLIGKNIWGLTAPDGIKVIQEERRAVANPAGDFIYYSWSKPSTNKVSPKVTFMKGIEDWQWMIGAGVYLDDCERSIATLHIRRRQELKQTVLYIVGITLAVILVSLFILKIISRYMSRDYELFIDFFNNPANSDIELNQDELKFKEFDELSTYANQMLRERVESQRKLVAEHERLLVTLYSIGDAVITTDIKGSVQMLNPVAEKLTGWQQAKALSRPVTEIFNIVDKTTREVRDCPVHEVFHENEIVRLQNHTLLLSQDGCEYDVEDSAAPILGNNQEIIGVVLVFRDVTAKLKLEQELRRSQQLESIGTLAGGIAHDFNNLLTSIFGNISLTKNLLEPRSEAFEFLAESEKSLNRATSLTAQLLTFAKGGAPVTKVQQITAIIRETAEFSLRGSNVKLYLDIAPDLWSAEVDAGQLSQVISNLVKNAQQSLLDRGGDLYVQAENVDNYESRVVPLTSPQLIKVSVRDQGWGIPAHLFDKILDPYFTTKEMGNGLGLATCHSIISRHGGILTFTSKVDQGSLFSIFIPAIQDKTDVGKSEEMICKPKLQPTQHLLGVTMLVMDDEPQICQLIENILLRFGAIPVTVADGSLVVIEYKQALERGEPYDLVLVDLTVPGGMGGQEAAENILQLDPRAKIIVSSGYANDPVMAQCRDYGFRGGITKPYNVAELGALLETVLTDCSQKLYFS